MDRRFKILSLDGGGVRGYLSILHLAKIEEYLLNENAINKTIGEKFDLIAGTSTGSIIAALLAIGNSANDILDIYKKDMEIIFSEKKWGPSAFYSKYSNKQLIDKAQNYFDDKKMNDTDIDLLIPSVSLDHAKSVMFRSDYLETNKNILISDAVIASCSAPTYFPAYKDKENLYYSDGGLAANNPSLLALLDALKFATPGNGRIQRKEAPTDISKIVLFSIGTGSAGSIPYKISSLGKILNVLNVNLLNGGYITWAKSLITLLMENQSSLVHEQVKQIMSIHDGSYIRIDPILKTHIALDDYKNTKLLTGYLKDNITDEDYYPELKRIFT